MTRERASQGNLELELRVHLIRGLQRQQMYEVIKIGKTDGQPNFRVHKVQSQNNRAAFHDVAVERHIVGQDIFPAHDFKMKKPVPFDFPAKPEAMIEKLVEIKFRFPVERNAMAGLVDDDVMDRIDGNHVAPR